MRAWARGVVALGAPARVERRVGVGADDDEDERVRFAHYELFAVETCRFLSTDRGKTLKIVPHARLHGTTEARRPPGPPRPGLSREDPYLPLRRVGRAPLERRARAHVALGVFEARAIARERNESYDRFGALRNDLERETMSNAGGGARASAGADFVRRVIVEYTHKSEKEMLEVLGGEKQVHIVKLDALLRRIRRDGFKIDEIVDFTEGGKDETTKDIHSTRRRARGRRFGVKVHASDLNAAISRAVEISKEQEHLTSSRVVEA